MKTTTSRFEGQMRFAFGPELIVDLFAGGGGASEGIKQAFGRDPDICINHDPVAVSMHEANHQGAKHYVKLRGTSNSADVADPLHTVSAQGFHHAEVRAFLIKFYGQGGQHSELADPMHTVPTRDRMGLVTVDGTDYEIADIGLRMLTPRELFRAQGFPESYQIDTGADGRRFTKDQQGRCCGNSVCPPIARAIVAANVAEIVEMERREAA